MIRPEHTLLQPLTCIQHSEGTKRLSRGAEDRTAVFQARELIVEAFGIGGVVAVRFAAVRGGARGVGWWCWWGEGNDLEFLGHGLEGGKCLVDVEGEVCEV